MTEDPREADPSGATTGRADAAGHSHPHSEGDQAATGGHEHPHAAEGAATSADAGHSHADGAGSGHSHVEPSHSHDHGDEHTHDDEHGHSHDDGHSHEHRGGLIGALINVFRPHSHDPSDSVDTALETSERGIRALKISLAALMATAVLQLFIVWISGSVALLADTVHNFSDALTSVPLWIAFLIARRLPDRRYTYGYHRAEDLAGVFIVAMIALSAVVVIYESIDRIFNPQDIANVGWVIAAGVIGFAGNELVAIYRIRVGKQIGSAALVADGYHAQADGFTSLAVIIGATGVMLGFPLADPIVGLGIGVLILWVLKGAASQVFGRLMDAVDPSVIEQIERVAASVPGVESVPTVRARWTGHAINVDLEIVVDSDATVGHGHDVSVEVNHRILHDVPRIRMVTVHVDPSGHRGDDSHAVIAHHTTTATERRQA